ncbi:thiosulfate dehydrogenase [quinone] large subunit [Siphonobacter sp. BAB-5404]|nr:thiosulfate dehydrogenase [quinone] large subunit [Siphonobacter sp. SORGH_AS_1065]MDR6195717.1 thiosulfate dehydrogenase [quinone] large subunit [Siphonobacter sp. SORGH_AS_0500]
MNNGMSFFLARLAVGTSLLGHGLVRMPKLSGFSAWMVDKFKDSLLPESLVTPFSYALPIAELMVGVLIVLGLFTRLALTAGSWIMISLIFGSSMVEDWGAIPSQLIHVAFLTVLLVFEHSHNSYSLDKMTRK